MSARGQDDGDEPGTPTYAVGHRAHQAGIPDDALRMGLDRNTEEGALVAMAGSLSPTKHGHRVIAWLLLVALVGPLLLGLSRQLF